MKIIFLLLFLCAIAAMAGAQTVEDKGKELYRSYGCALCHGWDGDGHGPNGQKYNPPPIDFHDISQYRHGLDRDSIRRSIQYGIQEDKSIMPAFEHIPPDEMQEIITYLQSLQKKK